jgi:diphthamide biosynthesis protein 2
LRELLLPKWCKGTSSTGCLACHDTLYACTNALALPAEPPVLLLLLLPLPQAGKKTYTLLMGKPNPAKLANFPEIEVFVMLADPQGLILDSKEYLSPIITPHEAYLAFTGKPFDAAAYRLDFGDLLAADSEQQVGTAAGGTAADGAAACVGGNVGEDSDSEGAGEEGEGGVAPGWGAAAGALVVAGSSQQGKVLAGAGSRSGQQVQVHSAAQYLQQHRTYKGLETPATGGEMLAAEKAVPGRSGRAAVYVDEPTAS